MKSISFLLFALLIASCSQEQQNKIILSVQNWTGTDGVLEVYAGEKLVRRFIKIDKMTTATGTDGVLEVYAGEKLVRRFIKIDKMTTATGTDDSNIRPYRYGYGVLDENLNMIADAGEKKVYFEISDYSTPYVFFE